MVKELFHYCSNIKCFSILESKTIWLSDIQKSNDYKELSLFFPKIIDVLQRMYAETPFPLKCDGEIDDKAFSQLIITSQRYWAQQFYTGEFSNFVICFSESADSLSQWRGYADNGKGCCLGFSFDEINEYCNSSNGVLRLEKVVYLDDEQIDEAIENATKDILEHLKGMREWIVNSMTHDDDAPDTDGLLHYNFDRMLEATFIDSLKYKSHKFSEEKEWRVFFSMPAYKNPKWIYNNGDTEFLGPDGFTETIKFLNHRIGFLTTDNDLIPYCPIKFDEFDNLPISSIQIGPKNKIRISDMILFLNKYGYKNVEILKSKITYC